MIRAALFAIAIVARRTGLRSRSCMIQGCNRSGYPMDRHQGLLFFRFHGDKSRSAPLNDPRDRSTCLRGPA